MCTAARASDGSFVIAYIPTVWTITVNMASLKSPAVGRWFDPTHGT
ncbi:MAG: putative collagen-binding domain-containing protein [Terriglobia bacterium]